MKIYVAAPWKRREDAFKVALQLMTAGHVVTSSWLTRSAQDDANGTAAEEDVRDLTAADVVVLLNWEKSEGKSVEQGLAICQGKPILAVGPKGSNVFQTLPAYRWFKTVEEVLTWLTL